MIQERLAQPAADEEAGRELRTLRGRLVGREEGEGLKKRTKQAETWRVPSSRSPGGRAQLAEG